MTTSTERRDVYATITNRIIAELEQGVRPWIKPWKASNVAGRVSRPLRHNFTPYRGINVLMLWLEAVARDYTSPVWMTFKQTVELGAHVRKGEHGTLIVYADRFTQTEIADNGESLEREIPFLRAYTVFNTAQIEGLPAHFYPAAELPSEPKSVNPTVEAFFAATGAQVQPHPSKAAYLPSQDCILMPPREAFTSLDHYFSTLCHETCHWSGAPGRLNRNLTGRFGTESLRRRGIDCRNGRRLPRRRSRYLG